MSEQAEKERRAVLRSAARVKPLLEAMAHLRSENERLRKERDGFSDRLGKLHRQVLIDVEAINARFSQAEKENQRLRDALQEIRRSGPDDLAGLDHPFGCSCIDHVADRALDA